MFCVFNSVHKIHLSSLQALSKNGKVYGNGIMVGVQQCIDKVRQLEKICVGVDTGRYYSGNVISLTMVNFLLTLLIHVWTLSNHTLSNHTSIVGHHRLCTSCVVRVLVLLVALSPSQSVMDSRLASPTSHTRTPLTPSTNLTPSTPGKRPTSIRPLTAAYQSAASQYQVCLW